VVILRLLFAPHQGSPKRGVLLAHAEVDDVLARPGVRRGLPGMATGGESVTLRRRLCE
jgi:hypothetical protein